MLNTQEINTLNNYFKIQPVFKAFVFGSYARNENDNESDLDLLVELDYSKPVGLKFIKMKLELEKLMHKKVDLVSENSVSKYIKPFIEKEKMLIYAK